MGITRKRKKTHTEQPSLQTSHVSVSPCLLGCRAAKRSEWVCDCASGAVQIAPSQGNPADSENAESHCEEKAQDFTKEMLFFLLFSS